MDFGAIIKRSWQITWRYKALWVLGIFAGVSGCQGEQRWQRRPRLGSRDFSQTLRPAGSERRTAGAS